jgi:hypothetical protein
MSAILTLCCAGVMKPTAIPLDVSVENLVLLDCCKFGLFSLNSSIGGDTSKLRHIEICTIGQPVLTGRPRVKPLKDSSQVDETFIDSRPCEVMLCAAMVTAPNNTSEQGLPRPPPPFELRLIYARGFTSEGRSSSSTEPILIGSEALRSGLGELYFGPLSCTLAYFCRNSQNHVGRRFCSFPRFVRECCAHFLGFHVVLRILRVVIE